MHSDIDFHSLSCNRTQTYSFDQKACPLHTTLPCSTITALSTISVCESLEKYTRERGVAGVACYKDHHTNLHIPKKFLVGCFVTGVLSQWKGVF